MTEILLVPQYLHVFQSTHPPTKMLKKLTKEPAKLKIDIIGDSNKRGPKSKCQCNNMGKSRCPDTRCGGENSRHAPYKISICGSPFGINNILNTRESTSYSVKTFDKFLNQTKKDIGKRKLLVCDVTAVYQHRNTKA